MSQSAPRSSAFSLIFLSLLANIKYEIAYLGRGKKRLSKEEHLCLGDFQVHLPPSASTVVIKQMMQTAADWAQDEMTLLQLL